MSRLQALLPLPLIFLLGACGAEPPAAPTAAEPPVVRDVVLAAVTPRDVRETTEVVGTVRSRTVTTLSSRVVGRVQAVHVREGSRVEPGQLLVELLDSEGALSTARMALTRNLYEATVSQARLELSLGTLDRERL